MHDPNQTPPDVPGPPESPVERGPSLPRALLAWLLILLVFGIGGMLAGQQELAFLAAAAGIFVAAQAADANRGWRELYFALGWVVPALGFVAGLAFGLAIWQSPMPGLARAALAMVSACAAGLAVLTVPTPVGSAIARALFRDPAPGHVLRLSARVVVLALALAVPGWFAAQLVMDELVASPESLMERVGLGGGLVGYVLLAFAGVGWMVRRDLGEAAARLGLAWGGWRDLLVAALALGALWGLNTGADLLQQRLFPDLWASDRRVTEAIASGMGPGRALLLGLSAGVGEEITLRGALQPRLGILLTSAFFGALHVQYSWYGMLVILALGLILGWTRRATNTTVAILAHTAYDVIAVLSH